MTTWLLPNAWEKVWLVWVGLRKTSEGLRAVAMRRRGAVEAGVETLRRNQLEQDRRLEVFGGVWRVNIWLEVIDG